MFSQRGQTLCMGFYNYYVWLIFLGSLSSIPSFSNYANTCSINIQDKGELDNSTANSSRASTPKSIGKSFNYDNNA